jgi:hypothetical protein
MNAFEPLITQWPSSSRGAGGAGVRAAAGLGQPERAQRLAGAQPRQPALLLLLGAEAVDGHGAQRDAGLQGDRDRGVDPRQLLERHAQREVVTARAAVLLGEGQAEQAQLPHLPHDRGRELVALVEAADLRGHHLEGELADGLAQGLGLGIEPVVQHSDHLSSAA